MTNDSASLETLLAQVRPGVRGIHPYEPGRPIEDVVRTLGLDPGTEIHKLASNENLLGPSPAAITAVRDAAAELHRYPDGGGTALLEALSGRLGIGPDHLALTHGSNEGIELLGHLFLTPGTNLVMGDPAFVVYRLVAALFDAEAIRVPLRDFTHDLKAMAAAVTDRTRLVFVANPNNPTGTRVGDEEIEALLDAVPDHVAAVLDEAYYEVMPMDNRPNSLRFVREGRPVIVLRTFSKGYGLAGLRIGYAVAPPPIVELFHRVRQPFNVNAAAQAGALAALNDTGFLDQTRVLVEQGRATLEAGFRQLGLPFVPSVANFILVRVGDGRALFERLQQRGFIVRPMDGYGMPDYVRVTVGTAPQNERFLTALEACLA